MRRKKYYKGKAVYKTFPKNIILPEVLVDLLETKIKENVPNFKFDPKIAEIFLWMIIHRTSNDWDIEEFDKYIPIPYETFAFYSPSNYKKYLNYLKSIDLIEFLGYKNFKKDKRCRMFRLSSEVLQRIWDEKESSFIILNLDELVSKIRIETTNYDISKSAKEKFPYLVKWYNYKLGVNYEESLAFLKNSVLGNDDVFRNLYKVTAFKNSLFYATHNSSSDGRLHTNLTNFPKILREFLRYDGRPLVSYDLKASQPYFLISILENLVLAAPCCSIDIDEERLFIGKGEAMMRYINSNYGYILDTCRETLISEGFTEELEKFKKLYNSDIYDELGKIIIKNDENYLAVDENQKDLLNSDGSRIWIRDKLVEYYDMKKQTNCMKTVPKLYKCKRDMMKVIVLNIFYGGVTRPCREYEAFKAEFPLISKFMTEIKRSKKEDFPKLLQQVESDCILNFVARELSIKYPTMPIWTIHDSIVTTDSFAESIELETEISNLIEQYSGVDAIIKKELFCESEICSLT